nr:GtrA family protein [Clostridium sp. D33t1_170424_F3]
MVLYITFGVLTTAVNILSFGLLRDVLHWELLTANTLAWVLSVAFAFVTNKLFVFQSKSFAARTLWREVASFAGARLLSLGVDTAGMWLLVRLLSWNDWLAKVIMNVIVIVLNYVFSKLFVFKDPHSPAK